MKGKERSGPKGLGAKILSLVLTAGVFLAAGPISSVATDLHKKQDQDLLEQANVTKDTSYGYETVTGYQDMIVLNEIGASYDLWIGGIQVTEANTVIDAGDIPGVTGTATYEANTNTLTLDSFTYAGTGYIVSGNSAVVYSELDSGLTIDLKHNSSITQEGETNAYGIFAKSQDVIFKGTGSIEITAGTQAFHKVPLADTGFTKGKVWAGDNKEAADAAGIREFSQIASEYSKKFVRIGAVTTISFEANGGTGTQSQQYLIGTNSENLKMNTFTRAGYQFTGWNTKADGSGTRYQDGESITTDTDVNLYAQWEKAVTGIAITTQPKLEYSEGETLDLSAMVITVTYADTTTTNIAYNSEGVTLSLTHGVSLSKLTHNGHAVTVSYQGKTANTNPLKVKSSDASVASLKVKDTQGSISGNTITVVLPAGTDLAALRAADFSITAAAGSGAALTTQPSTTDGGKTWTFTMTAENGAVKIYTVNVSVGTTQESQIGVDLTSAKSIIEGYNWTVAQEKANTTSLVKNWIEGILPTLNLQGATATVTAVTDLSAAQAGTMLNTAGRAGSFKFTVKLTKGGSELTATVTNGKISPTKYTGASFVAVTGITGVPTEATAKKAVTLTATVQPANATYRTVKWSIKDKGTTGASINGSTLSTTAAGNVVVTATITDGKAKGQNFTKDFTIKVKATENTAVTGVTISPASATVERGKTVQFTATVKGTGTFKKEVTWSIAGQKGNTSINTSGLLTIGNDETATTITVKAVSVGDTTKSATVNVSVKNALPSNHQHDFGPWQVTKDSTTTQEGTQQRKCSTCGHVETSVVAKKNTAASVPKTADGNKPGLWAAMMALSVAGAGFAVYLWKKEDMN